MSSVIFLFFTHLGIGVAGTLLVASHAAGVKFFRFNSGLATVFLLTALAFRPETPGGGWLNIVDLGALIVATGERCWCTGRRLAASLSRVRPVLLWTTLLAGGVVLIAQGLIFSAVTTGPATVLVILSFLSSTTLLGSAYMAMSLGHFYLVLPSMDIVPAAVDREAPHRFDPPSGRSRRRRHGGGAGHVGVAVGCRIQSVCAVY